MADPSQNAAAVPAAPSTNGSEQQKEKPGTDQTAEAPKKLTGAELKAQKQAEKAKRRAAAVAAKEAPPAAAPPAQAAVTGGDTKSGKQKTKHARTGSSSTPSTARPGPARRPSNNAPKPAAPAVLPEKRKEEDPRSRIPECFSHLSMAKRLPLSQTDKDVHPSMLVIGQRMGYFHLRDNMARLESTLLGLRKIIEAYECPPGHILSRHLVPHVINPQVEFLTECRPMCFAMGNAIRLLKARVSQLDVDTSDEDAIDSLCEAIDIFIQERICFAELSITRNAASRIRNGDIIVTYGNQRLVRKAFEQAWADGVSFEVVVIDDPYDPTGRDLAKTLRQQGLRVSYYPQFGGLTTHLQRASQVFLGAEAVLANGALYAPVGTSDIAMAARASQTPVIALCESINVDRDRVATDSLTYNEIDPERCSQDSFRLLFDTTRDEYVTTLITEYEESCGSAPSQAVNAVLRTKEDIN